MKGCSHLAAEKGFLDILRELVSYNCRIDEPDEEGVQPFSSCLSNGT